MFEPFINEPYSDFSIEENAASYLRAIEVVRSQLGRHYPLIIGDRSIDTDDHIESVNPANPSEVIGTRYVPSGLCGTTPAITAFAP